MRGLAAATLAVGLAVLPGCLGSEKTYRPLKGEPRPKAVEGPDPVEAEVQLKYNMPHEVTDDTTFIDQTRKGAREACAPVTRYLKEKDGNDLKDKSGKPIAIQNPWLTHQIDDDATLGPSYLPKHAPLPKAKPDRPEPKKKGEDEGGDAPAEKADKPEKAEKPEGGDKPAEKPGE